MTTSTVSTSPTTDTLRSSLGLRSVSGVGSRGSSRFSSYIKSFRDSVVKPISKWGERVKKACTPAGYIQPETIFDIEKSNALKSADTPIILILYANPLLDFEGAFKTTTNDAYIHQLLKKYFVVVQPFDQDLGTLIENASKKNGNRLIQSIIIAGHGDDDSILVNFTWRPVSYSCKDVRTSDFARLAPDATIIFDSCSVGKKLAPFVAKMSKKTVYAAEAPLDDRSLMLSFCPTHERIEARPPLACFGPDGRCLPPCEMTLTRKPSAPPVAVPLKPPSEPRTAEPSKAPSPSVLPPSLADEISEEALMIATTSE
jgi:hypothetical protein